MATVAMLLGVLVARLVILKRQWVAMVAAVASPTYVVGALPSVLHAVSGARCEHNSELLVPFITRG